MAGPSNLTPEQRTEIVLALLRREEPVSILTRRNGVSSKTLTQWKDDFIAAGTAGLAAGKRQASDNAKRLADFESAVAERDRVIGELTIANVILKKMVPTSPRRQFSPGVDGHVQIQPHCSANKGAGIQEFIADGFQHVRIQYRTPTQLGLLERFHKTLKAEEVYWRLYDNPGHCRQCLEAYHEVYNTIRPHWALRPEGGGDPVTPADVYAGGISVTIPKWQHWAKAAKKKRQEMMEADADKALAA